MKDNRRMKKVLSILLCLCIVLSYVPMPALAEEVTCTHHVHEGCTFDPSTCADCAVITNQPADWCGNSLCSQEDNAHAPGCAWYVRTYEECKCVLSCSEEGLNDYCETCFFEGVDACGGEEEAIVFTDFEISDGRLIKYNGSGGNITIPETVTSIDVYAFDGCSSLESVTIPGSVTTIWNYAFRNCTNLRSVTISGSVETINSYAFLGCSSLQSVTISGSVTTIGNHVFNACSNLRSLTISGSVTTIENYAFNGCSGLEEITISGSVTTIVNNAFNGCTGLTTVNVPCNWENSLYNFGDNVNVQKADHSFGTDGKCICGAECSHSYDAEGKCTVCNCVGGIIDVSTLTSDLMITDTGYSMNGKTYLYNGAYTLTGTTSHGVIFEAGEYQLTANNLKIVKGDTYSGSAIELKNGANLHLVLAGDNTLTGGWEGSGIRVNEGTSLTISGDGILRAGYQQGGNAAYGAAIGGYCNSNFGTITINGGTIYATGGGGASIGSGSLYGSSNTMAGTIVLNGGTIYADLIGNARSSGAVLKGSGAKVYCDSIRADTTGLNEIVYSKNGTSANVYNDLTLSDDFEVPGAGLIVKEGAVLTIPEGKTLTIAQNRQLICYGAIVNNGTIAGAGTVVNCLAQSDLTGSGTVAQTVSVKAVGSHVYGQWEYKDANIHIKTCQNGCGKTLTEGHIFENDVCTGCGKVKPWRYDETNRTLYILADLTIDDMYDIRAYDAECIVFAEGVRSIPDDVFHILHAHEVRSVHIPESIERIGLFAFDFGPLVGNTAIVFYCPEDIQDEVANSGGGHYGEAKVYVSYKMEDGMAKVTAVEATDPAQIDSNAVLDTVLYGKNVYFEDGTLTNFPNTPHVHRGTQWMDNYNGTCSGNCVVCGHTGTENHTRTYSASGNVITVSCSNCAAVFSSATITAEGKNYDGTAQETAEVTYSADWVDGALTPAYANNINPGTATASITIGGVTASVEFVITIPEAELATEKLSGNSDWYTSACLVAPSGYKISLVQAGPFSAEMHIPEGVHESVSYWLQPDNGMAAVKLELTQKIMVDETAPSVESIDEDITDNTATITLDVADLLSGVKDFTLIPPEESITFTQSGNSFSISGMNPNTEYTFKVKAEDNAGNWTYRNFMLTTTIGVASVIEAPTAKELVYLGAGQRLALVKEGTAKGGIIVYSLEKDGVYTTAVPTGTDVGDYTVWYYVKSDNADYIDGEKQSITVTIKKAKPVIETKPTAKTPTYNGTEQKLVTAGTVTGGTMVYSLTENGTYSEDIPTAKNAGNYTVWYYVQDDKNYESSEKFSVQVTIAKAEITVTPKEQAITYGKAVSDKEFACEGLLDGHSVSVTLTPSTKAVTSNGTITASAAVITAANTDVTANYNITYGTPAKLVIKPDTSKIKDLTAENVTSADKETIKEVQNMMANAESTDGDWKAIGDKCEELLTRIEEVEAQQKELTNQADAFDGKTVKSSDKADLEQLSKDLEALLDVGNLTKEERKTLEATLEQVAEMLDTIEDAANATDTDNTSKVENVTSESVTPEDKTDLEKAKSDLEKALEDNGGNYTEAEKKAIKDEIKRIDDALKVVENVETVEDAISDLPATVVPDDEKNVAKIEAAKKAYDALSAYEKSLVSKQTKETLDKLTAAAVAYDIIKGDGSEWKEDSNETLSFTANGAVSRFLGIEINGKTLDPKHYEVKAGSTIVTLKDSYLETLAAGEHSITVVYTDGETSGIFNVQAKSTVPATGDNSHLMLWFSLMIVSCAAILVLLNYKRFFSCGGKYSK